MSPVRIICLSLASLAIACGTSAIAVTEDGGATSDAGVSDAGPRDAGVSDAGPRDAGTSDAGINDAGTSDAGTSDAGMNDAGMSDAGMSDAGMSDAGMSDAGMSDAGTSDAGMSDAGTSDAGMNDAGTSDAGMNDAGSSDAGGDGGTVIGPGACGDGVLNTGEECDDGNTIDFDGCSSDCKLEQSQRVDALKLQFITQADGGCALNAFGKAVALQLAQQQIQTSLDTGVANGATSILLALLSHDPTGANANGLLLGVESGAPEEPAGSPSYNGSSDLDWWYLPDAAAVDSSGAPLAMLDAQIQGGVFTAGPGSVVLHGNLGGGEVQLALSQATIRAQIGALSAPLESTSGLPPGHLASEHVSPALTTFASTAGTSSAPSGILCANISAASLAASALPSEVASLCTSYTASSTILDLLVNGCSFFNAAIVNPTQPDQIDGSQTQPGAGAPYTLSASNEGTVVDTCIDRNHAQVSLADCLKATAYSSFFKLSTDRVIIRR